MIDESIRRRLENQTLIEIAERARLEAERSSRARSHSLATMSHELRTPLNAIIGYSELMTQHPARFSTASAKEPLERILRAGRHLLNLINELLDLAKIEAEKKSFQYEHVDVAALVRDVVETTRSIAEQNGNTVSVDCPVALAPLRTDPKRLTQVVLNLLSNACKFTERGKIGVSIVTVQEEGRKWEDLSVTDTGIGIAPSNWKSSSRTFPGRRGYPAKVRRDRSGLAISRRICQAMGGDLNVVSGLGKGSTFTRGFPSIHHQATPRPSSNPSRAAPR